jgi:hypothetical protein
MTNIFELVGLPIGDRFVQPLTYGAMGALAAIYLPRGFNRIGKSIGRNAAQEMIAASAPGAMQQGLGPGYGIGSMELYNRLTTALERLVSMTSDYGSRIANLEANQKKGG